MPATEPTNAQQVAMAASAFQEQRTGRAPAGLTVVLSEDTLVITLRGALTPAEQAMAASPDGAARVQEFHRQLFATSADSMRQEIRRITGVAVREAAVELDGKSGAMVHAFAGGTMVQVFLLAQSVAAETWSGTAAEQRP